MSIGHILGRPRPPGHTEETTMPPTLSYELAQARAADLRLHAQRDTAARAARRAPPGRSGHAGRGWPALDRRVRRKPSSRTVLAIASLGCAVAFIDATIVNIAFPDIARSFPGTSLPTLSWVLNAYNIVFAAFLMAAAGLADSLGRRRVFVFGLELFTAGSLLCAIAPSAAALIAFRVVQALGAASLVPSALSLVLNAFPPARRAHGVALLSAVGAAGAGLGPSLGGLLVTAANWRLVFLVNVPVGVAAVLLARRRLAESRAPGRRRIPETLLHSMPGTEFFARTDRGPNAATFVDTYTATTGHDACQPASVKDVEGLFPTSPAYPFHPNQRGQQVMADQVLAALGVSTR
jgi:hypothetical protein